MPKRDAGGAIRLIEHALWRSGLHSPEREIVRLLAEAGITVSVLNRNWQPVNVATVARKLVLLWNESARVVDPTDYQTYTWEPRLRLVVRSVQPEAASGRQGRLGREVATRRARSGATDSPDSVDERQASWEHSRVS